MEHIPRPFANKSREGHYLGFFSTPNRNEDYRVRLVRREMGRDCGVEDVKRNAAHAMRGSATLN